MLVMGDFRMTIDEIEELRIVTLGAALRKGGVPVSAFARALGVHPENYRKYKRRPGAAQYREPSELISRRVLEVMRRVEKRGAQAVRDEIMEKFATKRE